MGGGKPPGWFHTAGDGGTNDIVKASLYDGFKCHRKEKGASCARRPSAVVPGAHVCMAVYWLLAPPTGCSFRQRNLPNLTLQA